MYWVSTTPSGNFWGIATPNLVCRLLVMLVTYSSQAVGLGDV